MARLSAVIKNNRRLKLAKTTAPKAALLRKKAIDPKLSEEEREAARAKLQKLPRNGNMNRVRNRCEVTGRPRAFYRKLRMSRIALRDLASAGMIPGMTKASW
jgi:small subunit ribosomal protein S14